MTDAVGERIAEYAVEVAERGTPTEAARRDVEAAFAELRASEQRVKRAKEDLGMKRARLNRATEQLSRLLAAA